ncbi:MAG: hypothetical protein KGO92_14115 [Bacteroidota bacterium]|nr:hypothetical protein [Bacteroidota bacterium]
MKLRLRRWVSNNPETLPATLIAVCFVYFFTRHSGIGISPDSVMYASAAGHLRTDFSFTDFNGMPLVDFPAGYPSWLALFSMIFPGSLLSMANWLNGALFVGVLLLTQLIWKEQNKTTGIISSLFLLLLACSPCLIEVYTMLWSETVFLFLILLFLVNLKYYLENPTTRNLGLLALVTALACITRYAGISLVATGCLLILCHGEIPVVKKIKHLFLFGLGSSSLVFSNLLRNALLEGNFTGVREKSLRPLLSNLQEAGAVISNWFPFFTGHEYLAAGFFAMILTGGFCLLGYHMIQQQYYTRYETVFTAFFVVYGLFILVIASISRFEDLSSRLLSPIYIPMCLMIGTRLYVWYQKGSGMRKRIRLAGIFLLYGICMYGYYQQNAAAWEGIRDAGIPGYAEDSWTKSPLIAYIREHKDSLPMPVYANANDAVYFLTGIPALPLPHKEIKKEINRFLQTPSFYLAWFTDGENPDLVSLDFIRKYKKQVSMINREGGSLYFFSNPVPARLP